MKSQQSDLAAQVWQRVQEGSLSLQERQTLQRMISLLQADMDFLRRKTAPAVGKLLADQLLGQVKALNGIQVLSTGNPAKVQPQGQTTRNIAQCYRNALDRLNQYLLRSADPQFAPVYAQLAQETREHCRMIAQLAAQGR